MKAEVGMFIDFYYDSRKDIQKYHGKIIEIEKMITPWKDIDDGTKYFKVVVNGSIEIFNISSEDVVKYYTKEKYPELYI